MAKKSNSGTEVAGVDNQMEETMSLHSSYDDEGMTKDERVARLAATINGKVYSFPYNEYENVNIAQQLALTFVSQNLKDGQIFSMNHVRHAFFFLPECGIDLNGANYKCEYKEGSLTRDQLGYLIAALRSADLMVGDSQLKVVKPKPATSEVDCRELLTRPMESIRASVVKILQKQQKVDDVGVIISPGIDLKALLNYETKHDNRKPVVKLLNSALDQIGGMVEFLNKFDEVETIGPNTKPRPNAQGIENRGKDFVNSVM